MYCQALEGVCAHRVLRLGQRCFGHTAAHWLCERSRVRGWLGQVSLAVLVGCVGGWQGRSWEGQRPLEEKLHSRAVEAWSVPPDTLLGHGWGAPGAQAATPRSHIILAVELCPKGRGCVW